MLSQEAQKRILAHLYTYEDYRQFAYDDATALTVKAPKGNLTLGIGWNIQANGCPKEIAEFAAMFFVKKVDSELSIRLPFYETLDEPTKVALCDMGFTMGVHGLLDFTFMLDALKHDDRVAAAICMLNSKWAQAPQFRKRAVADSSMVEKKKWALQ